MFFLIRYHTVVASRRLINFARQFSSVSLVHRTETNIARQDGNQYRAPVLRGLSLHNCCAAKFSARNQNHTLPSRSAGREKNLPRVRRRVVPAPTLLLPLPFYLFFKIDSSDAPQCNRYAIGFGPRK